MGINFYLLQKMHFNFHDPFFQHLSCITTLNTFRMRILNHPRRHEYCMYSLNFHAGGFSAATELLQFNVECM